MKDRKYLKPLLFVLILGLIIGFYVLGGDQYLTLEYVQGHLGEVRRGFEDKPFLVAGIFCLVYIFLTSLSIPGTIVLTLLSGAIFGVGMGTAFVIIPATLGATVAFLMARYLLRDLAMKKFEKSYKKINQKIREEGLTYLLILRMIPISPFVVVNNVMGLTSMSLWTYMLITSLGMIPGTFIYVFAGRKIAEIQSVGEILSWPILLSLTAVGLLPILVRKVLLRTRKRSQWRAV